jgi:hypothetical protein
MKILQSIFSLFLFAVHIGLFAQPIHNYEFNNSYSDAYGGNAMIPNGGSLTSTAYLFEKGQGPHVSNVIDPNTYSIVMRFTPHYIDSWAKILDFKNRTVDGGVYISGGNFYFSNSDFSISGVSYSVFTQDIPATVCITRDGATKEVYGYVDGTLQWSFEDINDEATFTGPGNIIQILIDDLFLYFGVNSFENTNGSLDYFRIYNQVVTVPNAINPSCGNIDSDCDGISNDCDVCPGGDDNGPCNAATLPSLNLLPSNWMCSNNSNNEKILVCHQGSTICVSESGANTHLAHGDFLGPCTSCQNYSVAHIIGSLTDRENLDFELGPNPVYDELTVQLSRNKTVEGQIIIYDQLGKEILSRQLSPGENYMHFDLQESRFPGGVYYASLISNGIVQTKRFVIAK